MKSKEANKEYNKQWYIANKDHIKQYRINNSEKIKKYMKEYSKKNKEAIKLKRKEYVKTNSEKIKLQQQKRRNETIKIRKEYDKKYGLKRKYNISSEHYIELFNKQNGRCAICGIHQNELKKSLGVDHNHKTNKIRGLLCDKCNRGLGYFNDELNLLVNATNFLKNNN
jgi:hypothetical protein